MTNKKVGSPPSLVSYSHFSTEELNVKQIRHAFNMRVHEGALNDAINYPKGARPLGTRMFLAAIGLELL